MNSDRHSTSPVPKRLVGYSKTERGCPSLVGEFENWTQALLGDKAWVNRLFYGLKKDTLIDWFYKGHQQEARGILEEIPPFWTRYLTLSVVVKIRPHISRMHSRANYWARRRQTLCNIAICFFIVHVKRLPNSIPLLRFAKISDAFSGHL